VKPLSLPSRRASLPLTRDLRPGRWKRKRSKSHRIIRAVHQHRLVERHAPGNGRVAPPPGWLWHNCWSLSPQTDEVGFRAFQVRLEEAYALAAGI